MFPLKKKDKASSLGKLLVERDRMVQSSMLLNNLKEQRNGEETNKIL